MKIVLKIKIYNKLMKIKVYNVLNQKRVLDLDFFLSRLDMGLYGK
jgi:hypothetical protein